MGARAGVEGSSAMTTAGKVDLAGDGFFVLVDLLEAAKAGLPDEVPSPLDDRFSEIASAYRKADPALRQQVREQIPAEYWLPLLQLSDRCAEWALVDKDPRHLEDGLTAYCLEDFRFDAHENLVHLSRLWYAGKTLHADTMGIFNQVGRCGSPHGLQELSNFSARPEEAKSPRSMGLENIRKGATSAFAPEAPKGRSRRSREGELVRPIRTPIVAPLTRPLAYERARVMSLAPQSMQKTDRPRRLMS